jgi:hypothetical protein
MRFINILVLVSLLALGLNMACAVDEEGISTIKSELESKGYSARVAYVENSTYGNPAYVIVVDVPDGDYLAAARKAMVAAAGVVYNIKYTTDAIIGLAGPSEKAYQFRISYRDLTDIVFYGICGDLDTCKDLAENHFDSATTTTPQELDAYFKK